MPRYLLQRTDRKWEEVDEFTAKNRTKALDDAKDAPRYTEAFCIIQDSGNMRMNGTFAPNDLQWLMRFAGQRSGIENAAVAGGMLLEPDMIRFIVRGKKTIHMLKTGETYKLVA